MVTIKEILQVAWENKASDVHITVGIPPKMRVNGQLKSCQSLRKSVLRNAVNWTFRIRFRNLEDTV